MPAWSVAITTARGWRRRFIALGAGAFGALALAPLDIGPALIVTMVVAVWLIDGCRNRTSTGDPASWRGTLLSAFVAGWWIGFGYFLAGFWWLESAFLIDPSFAWALPIGVIGVPAMLAIFTGIGFVLARLLWTPTAARVLALALGLGVSEWARGHLFTGFPWNAFGMGLGGMLVTAQTASLVGLDGLTFLAIALYGAPATLTDRRDGQWSWRPTAAATVLGLAIVVYGAARLATPPPPEVPGVVVRIMQPGLWPDQSFSPENKDEIVAKYIALSKADDPAKGITLADVTLLVWPESAFPFILTRDQTSLDAIGAMLPARTTLATGAAREVDVPARNGQQAYSDYYNAILVIARGGRIIDSYDKIHLVPFGEYLPYSGLLSRLGLRNFVPVPGGFVPGSVHHALTIPGLPPITPLICYEAIFPGEVAAATGGDASRPRALLNVTNDGWFGLTTGPSQHFAQARLRAIEQGLPMIRGAATGISAIVDPYGRIGASLPLGATGILDSGLPEPIPPPPFSTHGNLLLSMVWLSTLLILLYNAFAGNGAGRMLQAWKRSTYRLHLFELID